MEEGIIYIVATGYMQHPSKRSSTASPAILPPGLSKAVSIRVADE